MNWKDTHPGYGIFTDAKYRAGKRGLEFSITYEEFLEKDVDTCPYLGIPIFWHPATSTKGVVGRPDSKSIDRIDPTKGYTYDNFLIVSWRSNSIKSDATYEEMCTLIASLKTILTEHEVTY